MRDRVCPGKDLRSHLSQTWLVAEKTSANRVGLLTKERGRVCLPDRWLPSRLEPLQRPGVRIAIIVGPEAVIAHHHIPCLGIPSTTIVAHDLQNPAIFVSQSPCLRGFHLTDVPMLSALAPASSCLYWRLNTSPTSMS